MIDLSLVSDVSTYRGQNTVSTLNGNIAIEEGNGRLAVRDSTTNAVLSQVDRDGLKVYDQDNGGDEAVRAGKFPGNNGYGLAVAEPGESIEEAIT